jgi:flagellar basal-body rod protein FlgB
MFIERLMNQTDGPLLERYLQFSAARQKLLNENLANVDVPGYRYKDLSESKFVAHLRERAAERARSAPGSVGFDDIDSDLENPTAGILYHDKNNRSMEKLMSDISKNGMRYTMAIELLKKQYSQMEMALRERVS